MEIALDKAIPTYSGGLGVLAGDTLRSAADLAVPVVGVTLLHRKGYFEQHIDASGNQTESPVGVASRRRCSSRSTRERPSSIEGRTGRTFAPGSIRCAASRATKCRSTCSTRSCPRTASSIARSPTTSTAATATTACCQEVVLGMGGAELLRALELSGASIYHLNEGHSALLTLCLLEWQLDGRKTFELDESDIEAVRRRCVFTTHTPVPAGHDKFPIDMVAQRPRRRAGRAARGGALRR